MLYYGGPEMGVTDIILAKLSIFEISIAGGGMLYHLAHPPPSLQQVVSLVFMCVAGRAYWGVGGGAETEPNHTTARKPGSLLPGVHPQYTS